MNRLRTIALPVALTAAALIAYGGQEFFAWGGSQELFRNHPPEWYASEEAIRIADNMLLYQRENGGWPKGRQVTGVLSEKERATALAQKQRTDTTLDNDATHSQIRFLARVHAATKLERFRNAIVRGIDWLLAAQYPSGGWPQFHPDVRSYNPSVSRRNPEGLARFITFNDGAMTGAMRVLEDVARRRPEYSFVDEARRTRAAAAIRKGVACILRCQVRVNGKRTVWAAQHDDRTFEPRWGRTFEPAALVSRDSVEIVRFLMQIENPSPEVKDAIRDALEWFRAARLTGIRVVRKPDPSTPRGYDRVVEQDPQAAPVWARYYEIGTNRPIFGDVDDEAHYRLADISPERRTGYDWYGAWPEELLSRDYPAWRNRLATATAR